MEWEDEKDWLIVEASFKDLTAHIEQFLPHVSLDTVNQAFEFANIAHFGQRRLSGEPYITHPLEVAKILAELKLDTTTIVCALLHDVVEDTSFTLQEIEDRFGKTEAKIIKGLTKISTIESGSVALNEVENLRKLLMAVAEDVRVLLIKLADRLHNMRTISAFTNSRKRTKIAKETIDIYAPLADRIGMHFFKNILYDIAFDVLYPNVRQSIIDEVEKFKSNGNNDVDNIVNDVKSLMDKYEIDANVAGREKSPFSIWQKMEKKQVYFDQLSDIFAIRIITTTPIDCYRALGAIHINYPVLSKEFFDYISTPKPNGYRSIHTVITYKDCLRVEIQIRTKDMHNYSELGMAAHWMYKNSAEIINDQDEWLVKIRSTLEKISNSNDTLSNIKLEMYNDQVFCFTPKRDIIILPRNATPLDFAFEVSRELGSHYNKAIVNGIPASITTHLQSGDQVEILTSDHITINHHWHDIVSTSKARSEIEVYLNKKSFDSFVFAGNLSIYDECEKYKLELTPDKITEVAALLKVNKDDLLFRIGNGSIKVEQVINILTDKSLYQKARYYITKYILGGKSNKSFKSLANLRKIAEIHFGYCCNASSEKTAIGIWNKTHKFVIIHSSSCTNIRAPTDDEELCNIVLSDSKTSSIDIILNIIMSDFEAADTIFETMTNFGLSNYSIDVRQDEDGLINMIIDLKLLVPHQLESLTNKLRKIRNVIDVTVA
jgi:GTP pyrophosphokinase